MSIAALNWAWTQTCPNATSKLVLLAVADHANADGRCWPKMTSIAQMVGISPRQVSTHLVNLVDAGLLSRVRERKANGQQGRYVYTVNIDGDQEKPASSGSRPPVEADRQWKQTASGSTLPVDPEPAHDADSDRSDLTDVETDQEKPASSGSTPPVEAERRNHRKRASGHKATTTEPPENLASAAPKRQPRPPDPIFDALIAACGLDVGELTASARGALNKAAKELREINASPQGIAARAGVHRKRWPDAELTPTSLAKNYAQLGARPPRASPDSRRGDPSALVGSPEWEARQRERQRATERLAGLPDHTDRAAS